MFGNLQSPDDDRRTEPPFRQKRAKAVRLFSILFGIAICALVALNFIGRPMLSKWRYDRDLKKAVEYEEDGDQRSAMLTLEQASRLHPTDPIVRRRLAGFYERAGQAESVVIWREAMALDPQNPEGQMGLARAAIRFGDAQTARKTLDGFTPDDSHRAEYHRLRAGLGFLEKDPKAQEENLAALAKLDPSDQRIRLNLATLQISDPQGLAASPARAALLELARGNQVRVRAVVELLSDVARRWPAPSPGRDAELKSLADALAPARGPLLELPSRVDHIDRLISYAMTQPSPTPEDAVSLANWMSLNGHTEAALQWLDALPETAAHNPLVQKALTEFAVRSKDWTRLQKLLRNGAWGAVPAEAVEQAFRVRRTVGSAGRPLSASGWSSALEAAKTSPAALRMLLRLAELWEWPAEYRQVLLTIARTLPRENWAWRQLISRALAEGDADQLWQVYQEWRRAVPGDQTVQIEAAIMGSLLDRRPAPNPEETAEYIRHQPVQPGASVAHALALWRAKRPVEAAALLDGLPAATFSEPRYALAYAVILAEVNRARESGALLDRVSAEALLPDERALVRQAREKNLTAPAAPRG